MFPDAQFAKRGPKHELRQVIKIAKEKEFTDLIVVNEDRKIPSN
jgi:ribosome production factor 1